MMCVCRFMRQYVRMAKDHRSEARVCVCVAFIRLYIERRERYLFSVGTENCIYPNLTSFMQTVVRRFGEMHDFLLDEYFT